MQIGDKIEISGHAFKCVAYTPHISESGRESIWLVMAGRCAECGARFKCTISRTQLIAGKINRRCDIHKRPGVVVDRRRSIKRAEAHRAAMARARTQLRQLRSARWLD